MDFNIDEVRNDIEGAKEYIAAKHPFSELEKLGQGTEGDAHAFKSAVIKRLCHPFPEGLKKNEIRAGEAAIAQGINAAPYLDSTKGGKILFAPYINGLVMQSKFAGKNLTELDEKAYKKYFADGLGLAELGFSIDIHPSNFILTGQAINFIDMHYMHFNEKYQFEECKVLQKLAKAICWGDQIRAGFFSLHSFDNVAQKMHNALKQFKDSGLAEMAINDYVDEGLLNL